MALKPDLGMMLLGTDALSGGAETMRKYIPEVRKAADIEAVHQMRVASRRLRAALTIFGPVLTDLPVRRWRRAVRGVTRALGEARDVDVQIDFVARFVKDHVSDARVRPGLERLQLRMAQQRQRLQEPVEQAMGVLEGSGVLDQIGRFARKTIAEGRLARVVPGGDAAVKFGQASVRGRLGELFSYESYVGQPACSEQLHQMRIAAKWLRYTMELFVPVFGDTIKPYIKRTKRLQTLLGDLHDMDVWLEALPAFVEDERERTVAYFGRARGFGRLRVGLDYLLAHCIKKRRAVYDDVVAYWGELEAASIWEQLLQMCDPPLPRTTLVYPADGETPERPDVSVPSS